MAKQPKLSLYGKGVHKTKSGHLRYHSPVSIRNKYVHQIVVQKLLDETPEYIKAYLPWPFEIHHMDYNKEHNCGNNLLIVSEELHSAMTADRPRDDGGRFGRKFIPRWSGQPPQYRIEFLMGKDEGKEEEIPF